MICAIVVDVVYFVVVSLLWWEMFFPQASIQTTKKKCPLREKKKI